MSRFQMFQATILTATLTLVVLGAATIHPPAAGARRAPAVAQNAGTTAETPAMASARKAPPSDSVQPNLFGGWWKKFKKIFMLLIDFIDALIDNTKELITDAGPTGSFRPDRWSPTRPNFPDPFPQA
ncbi:MAG: hypothetical protein SGI90_07315 [Candidatus Eisenbacteria bacterium]|nr:hypothetical protein [Candidatus Eisenbacteria bacterium]